MTAAARHALDFLRLAALLVLWIAELIISLKVFVLELILVGIGIAQASLSQQMQPNRDNAKPE